MNLTTNQIIQKSKRNCSATGSPLQAPTPVSSGVHGIKRARREQQRIRKCNASIRAATRREAILARKCFRPLASDEEILAEDLHVDLARARRKVIGVLVDKDRNGSEAPRLPPERVGDASPALVLPLVHDLVRGGGLLSTKSDT